MLAASLMSVVSHDLGLINAGDVGLVIAYAITVCIIFLSREKAGNFQSNESRKTIGIAF